jgi:hypothetical protein
MNSSTDLKTDLTAKSMIIPLDDRAHLQAQELAKIQATPEKASQVYRNALVVYACHIYLTILQIENDLDTSEGWHPFTLTFADVATINLPKLGELECALVGEKETIVSRPKSDKNLIGCLVFQGKDEDLTELEEVKVLGFTTDRLPVAIDCLESDVALLDRLEYLTYEKLFTPVIPYYPERTIEQIRDDLELIYQQSEQIYFPYQISQYLAAGSKETIDDRPRSGLSRDEFTENPELKLQMLAAELAEQLQDIWGRLAD